MSGSHTLQPGDIAAELLVGERTCWVARTRTGVFLKQLFASAVEAEAAAEAAVRSDIALLRTRATEAHFLHAEGYQLYVVQLESKNMNVLVWDPRASALARRVIPCNPESAQSVADAQVMLNDFLRNVPSVSAAGRGPLRRNQPEPANPTSEDQAIEPPSFDR